MRHRNKPGTPFPARFPPDAERKECHVGLFLETHGLEVVSVLVSVVVPLEADLVTEPLEDPKK
jgi:hypothetical protein